MMMKIILAKKLDLHFEEDLKFFFKRVKEAKKQKKKSKLIVRFNGTSAKKREWTLFF